VTQLPGFGRRVDALSSATPAGPWVARQTIATVPDPGPGRYTYNAVLHPELADGGGQLLSYNTNSFDAGELNADGSIYRPRFLRVQLP
jgi:hypothetical protein